MTLNKDLFGDLIPEKPAAVPVSVRPYGFTHVFHSSNYIEPPHHRGMAPEMQISSNVHENIVHMGTLAAAQRRGNLRTIHEYRIPNHLMDVAYMDSDAPLPEMDYDHKEWNAKNKTPGLWEHTKKDKYDAADSNLVTPYRNQFEDIGNLSFMVPKHLIREGKTSYDLRRAVKPGDVVQYLGVFE